MTSADLPDVVNGEKNTLYITIENKEPERNVTLKNIAASLHNAQTDKLVKNVRVMFFVVQGMR